MWIIYFYIRFKFIRLKAYQHGKVRSPGSNPPVRMLSTMPAPSPSVSVNKVSLEHSYSNSLVHCLWLLSCSNGRVEVL